MDRILPELLAFVTRKRRYKPEIVWSDKSWTHNIFRVYELIFWRKYGIRAEARSTSDGHYEVYTFEAFCALIETQVRRALKWQPIEFRQPQLAGNPYGYWFPQISFAIALDVASTFGTTSGSATSPITWSHTVTGANPFLYVGSHVSGSNTTATSTTGVTYNSVAMTSAQANSSVVSFACHNAVWFLGNPATGANTVSLAFSGGSTPKAYGGAVSYSGAQSSSTKDASNGTNGTGTGAKSTSVTTVAANCWVVCNITNSGSTSTLTAGNTSRWNNTIVVNQSKCGGEDTNASVGAGTVQSMSWTVGTLGTNFAISAASFAPIAANADLGVTVSDSMTITELILRMVESFINKSDSMTITEAPIKAEVNSFINKSDSTTVTENLKLLGESFVNQSDSMTITENPGILIPFLNINKSESMTVTESLTRALAVDINISDSMAITESLKLVTEMFITQSDSMTVSESFTRLAENFINKSDSMTVTESIQRALANDINVSDSMTISESLKVLSVLNVNQSDSMTISESIALFLPELFITLSDLSSISENLTFIEQEDVSFVLGDTLIKNPSSMVETNSTLYVENRVLDGDKNRVYFGDNKRIWILNYKNAQKSEYDTIKALYDLYLSTGTATTWRIGGSQYVVPQLNVHVDLSERTMSNSGTDYLSDFTLVLVEAS